MNSFFKAPEIVIVRIDKYNKIWFDLAIILCPGKILFPKEAEKLKLKNQIKDFIKHYKSLNYVKPN